MESQNIIAIVLASISILGTIITGLLQLRKWNSESRSFDAEAAESISAAWEKLNIRTTEKLISLENRVTVLEKENSNLLEENRSLKLRVFELENQNISLKEKVEELLIKKGDWNGNNK